MRAWLSLILLLACGAAQAQGPVRVSSSERRLDAAEIRALAQRELLWCEDYRKASDDCSALTLIRLGGQDRVVESVSLLISVSPRLEVTIGNVQDLRDGQLCGVLQADKLPVSFAVEGRAVPPESALGLRALLASSVTQLDGKTICHAFYAGADPLRLREEVTVDGVRRRDLESEYLLRSPTDGSFALRPQGETEAAPVTHI